MAALEFPLADIGEGLAEAEVVQWLVRPGDSVVEDQPVVVLLTDKATVEITSPWRGSVLKLGVEEGQRIKVGARCSRSRLARAAPQRARSMTLSAQQPPIPAP